MIVFLDLDGPILDVSEKYYQVYVDILQRHGFDSLSKKEYWNAKRNKVPESEILEQTDAMSILESYQRQRKLLFESDQYLKFDRIQDGTTEVLENFAQHYRLVLVTLRTFPEQLYKELKCFNLNQYFSTVLTSGSDIKPRWKIKYNLINSYLKGTTLKRGLIIGDTETDILAGKKLRFKTVGVLNGIRSYDILFSAQPTHLVSSISEILRISLEHGL